MGRIFHSLNYCLQKELVGCNSVLDLGCGPSSPLQHCVNVKYSVGVEAFRHYLEETQKRMIHTKYINKRIEELDFPENNFDAVIMLEVLEHLPQKEGYEIIKKAEKWARKKIILSTPNGYFPMEEVDNNIYQNHLSGWDVGKLKKEGFLIRGLSGAKIMYSSENRVKSIIGNNKEVIFANLRFKPKEIVYTVNAIAQIAVHYFPRLAFGLWAIKRKKI
ncbi:MAG: class I SAM-dependent methyltransferase [Candidatus Omnitrophica bacterium]|nr:class I SAM-dependent methyltransferase [Candidatus Omnitrophota bacterium]